MHHPVLDLRDVSYTYGDGVVLRDVDLTVREGGFYGIVGPSGAGKTTLLRLMEGALRPGSGVVDRRPGGRAAPRLGVVPQLESIDWTFPITVEEVVLLGMTSDGRRLPWATRAMRGRAREVLERLGIAHLAARHIRNLSGGQQQRTFVARALVRKPDLLLLDEPTSGVDVATRHDILHLLHNLNHEGIAIVLTTHDLNAVAAHLPHLVCVRGKIVAEGAPADVLTTDILRELYGAEMIVVERDGMILIGDAVGATVEPHPRDEHPAGTPAAHFGPIADHDHRAGSDHTHDDAEARPWAG